MSTGMAGAAVQAGGAGRWSAMLTVMSGMIGIFFSMTMVNIAIPDVMGEFGVGQDQAQFMVTGFLSAMTVAMLLTGWFMMRFGVRASFCGGMALFCVCSILAEQATSYPLMVACRVVMGACAGLLEPLAMATIFRTFPVEQRGAAMGLFGMGVVLGPAVGPAIGGLIVDNMHWRYVFVAPVPLCLFSLVLALAFLPGRDESAPAPRLNLLSLGLISIAIAAVLTAVSNGQRLGWDSATILGAWAAAGLATVALLAVELGTKAPLLRLRLFTDHNFAAAFAVSAIMGAGLFGTIYLLPLLVRTVQGFTATGAGMVLLPSGAILILVFPIAGRLAQGLPPGVPILAGFTLFSVASFILAGADADAAFLFIAFWALAGRVGMGLVFPAVSVAGFRTIGPELLPYAAGIMTFGRMLGGALGTNALAIFVELRFGHHADQLTATQAADNSVTLELLDRVEGLMLLEGFTGVLGELMALEYLQRMVSAQAIALAFQDGFVALGVAFLVGYVPALLLMRK